MELLISFSLVQSCAYPAAADLDPQLESLLKEPKTCLSVIASVNEEAASILQFYLSGYATLRRFYEIRDEAVELEEGQRPRFKLLARRRAAAKALAAVISSAADNIYGGLFDPDRDSAVQVDGLMALLGEALVFVNRESSSSFPLQSSPVLVLSTHTMQNHLPFSLFPNNSPSSLPLRISKPSPRASTPNAKNASAPPSSPPVQLAPWPFLHPHALY